MVITIEHTILSLFNNDGEEMVDALLYHIGDWKSNEWFYEMGLKTTTKYQDTSVYGIYDFSI